jgi:hypothetical protein
MACWSVGTSTRALGLTLGLSCSLALAACEGFVVDAPLLTGEPDAGPTLRADASVSVERAPDAAPPRSDAGPVVTQGDQYLDVCDAPLELVDTRKPTTVVGSGPGTCTEQLLDAALAKGGIITFDCGPDAVIPISSEKVLRIDKDTTLDGEGQVTLDGQDKTRILSLTSPDFQKTETRLTLQRMRLIRGKASGSVMFEPASPPCSQGYKDGSGGALYVRDADVRIIQCTFEDNHSASPGPDVAGGAIYVLGTRATTIVSSVFRRNSGSNGGAVGALFGNLTVYNSLFEDNVALGTGANSINDSCPIVDGQREIGNGGNGGAVVMDGTEEFTFVFCGSVFRHNVGGDGAFGGALFRTPDLSVQKTQIDRCTFDKNESGAGGALYFHHSTLEIEASTFVGNIGREGGGAIQADDTDLSVVNSTFADNAAQRASNGGGPRGGAITLYGNRGKVQSCTFVGNTGQPGDGQIGGALIGAKDFTIDNSLFVDNQTLGAACDASATGSHDLQWPSGAAACVQGIEERDPQLSKLAGHGGPTRTFMPEGSSPAARMGSDCPDTDQRGYPRASACTLGAVELGAQAP